MLVIKLTLIIMIIYGTWRISKKKRSYISLWHITQGSSQPPSASVYNHMVQGRQVAATSGARYSTLTVHLGMHMCALTYSVPCYPHWLRIKAQMWAHISNITVRFGRALPYWLYDYDTILFWRSVIPYSKARTVALFSVDASYLSRPNDISKR